MKQYNVTGMSCAACQARVERAVSEVPGVENVAVSLLTNSMGVEGTAKDKEIIKAVEAAGYGCAVKTDDSKLLEDKETPKLIRRLIASVVLCLILMYFSMGHIMWGWPAPTDNPLVIGIIEGVLALAVILINNRFFVSGFKGVIHGSPNMDTLVSLGSGTSFIYSIYLLVSTGSCHELYFESAAMILALITVGKTLEAKSKGRTTDALKSLMKLAPKTATVIRDGEEIEIPIEELKPGDEFIVRPGETIPTDGQIIEGMTSVDESAFTGESIPADKQVEDFVCGATINQQGFIRCTATRVGQNTTFSQIVKMMSDAAATKAPIAKVADKVSGIFVPAVIFIALLTMGIWLIVGKAFSFAIIRGVSVLVVSCPCALGLATPVAIMVGNGVGAKNGILFKTAVSLEEVGKAGVVVLDKTGTITEGKPVVTDVIPNDVTRDKLLQYAYSIENLSSHPLANAVVSAAKSDNVKPLAFTDFEEVPGNGLKARLKVVNKKQTFYAGNYKYIKTVATVPEPIKAQCADLAGEGKTPLIFAMGKEILGVIAVADKVKTDSKEAIDELHNLGLRVVMLTGDNERTANAVARNCGVDDVVAGVLPDGKAQVVKQYKRFGKVLMVGDGVNDAPALATADMGLAIGAGTDVAIDAADVVLMNSTLSDVPAAIRLSRRTLSGIHQNLFWAFFYNAILIPIAAVTTVSPMICAAAMSLSSFFVVTNALRINLFDIHSARRDKMIKVKETEINEKETSIMEKTVHIEGMMCPHCEANVKQTLEAFAEVDSAVVSHEAGTAVIALNAELDDEKIKAAIEEKGYKVV
ncbi:MAG: heavy metal translocating P-type ATPase [Clostridia bacterium]|nr:heavy metal translocating P-type ATPase [Clostridia bacterium]